MLSVRNLVKTYSTKGGVEVKALDNVSIDFPETGLVFLLGRSGSGKSTLLNVAGGLDMPTDGEIIVKGRSSKDFTVADFDSYRNTYVGFVFQDYNLLDEFSVEQNIAIALQLQSKPNDSEAVEKLLESVDLGGIARRKPNTLSGGQKQRVAIARALIKEPEIIMADEPTGALDSATGVQIFETLKKLSKTKLVIVVSHDRAFASQYADRIIELEDGKVISDMTRIDKGDGEQFEEKNVSIINDETIKVADWDKVSENEIKEIVCFMKKQKKQTIITTNQAKIAKIDNDDVNVDGRNSIAGFNKTTKINRKQYNGQETKFIKSKLPFTQALKMAGSTIKVKPFRLIFTILLSVIAFTIFGLTSTLMLYDPDYSVAKAMASSHYESVALDKRYNVQFENVQIKENGDYKIGTKYNTTLSAGYTQKELDKLNSNKLGLDFAGIIDFGYYKYTGLSTGDYVRPQFRFKDINKVEDEYQDYYYVMELCGFSDCGEEYLTANGFVEIAEGKYPTLPNEIAISEYVFNLYKNSIKSSTLKPFDYEEPKDIVGINIIVGDLVLTVSGVYKTGDIPKVYDELYNKNTDLDDIKLNQLKYQFEDYIKYSFHTVGYVSDNFYETHKNRYTEIGKDTVYGFRIDEKEPQPTTSMAGRNQPQSYFTPRSVSVYNHLIGYYDLEGNKIENFSLSGNQVCLSIYDVIDDHFSAFNNAISALSTDERQAYADVLSAMRSFKPQGTGSKATIDEVVLIYQSMIENYEKIVKEQGKEEFKLPEKVYGVGVENYVELEVVGVHAIPRKGVIDSADRYVMISDQLIENNTLPPPIGTTVKSVYYELYKFDYTINASAEKYGLVLTKTDNREAQTAFILQDRAEGVHYAILNEVYELSNQMAGAFDQLKIAFLIAGLVFGLFASLMLYNFISVGIESKKNEIGILRAVGARGADVFKIFIIEALIVTTICFALSTVASIILCSVINSIAVESVISISFLNFRLINLLFILIVSVVIALIATIMPVSKAARLSPVESIRAL